MICVRCRHKVPDGKFCSLCGWRQAKPHKGITRRLAGEGTVWMEKSGKYRAVQRVFYRDNNGKLHEYARTKLCCTKEEAIAILPALKEELLKKHPEMGTAES